MEREKGDVIYIADYFLSLNLGYTRKQAQELADSWNFRLPEDLQERMKHIRQGVDWERKMRLLNTGLKDGRITQEEYQKRARRLGE